MAIAHRAGVLSRVDRLAARYPDQWSLDGDLAPEERYRGLFTVLFYRLTGRVQGGFGPFDPATLPRDFIITAESEDGTIMGIEHASEPVAAVQFHPESIMTLGQDAGMRMIENVVAHLSKKARVKAA